MSHKSNDTDGCFRKGSDGAKPFWDCSSFIFHRSLFIGFIHAVIGQKWKMNIEQ
jgi:hypothetical protein